MTDYAPGQKVHKFELSGLGKAPYVFLGVTQNWHSAAPGHKQPGGCCDYCSTGIAFEFWLRSADGRKFKVGSDCILKTSHDRSLIVAVKTEVQKHQKALRDARAEVKRAADVARIEAAKVRLPEVADRLRKEPHPQAESIQFLRDKTKLDWAEWMLANAGTSGRLAVARAIEELVAW